MFNRLKHSNWSGYIGTLIIGGLLVALGYFIGDSAPSVEAQDGITRFDTIACKGLTVSDGNPEHGAILLGIIEEHPVLVLSDHADFDKAKIQIQISVGYDIKHDFESAVLKLLNRHNDGSSIGLIAGRGETALIDMNTAKRITPGISLTVGAKGSGMILEGELVLCQPSVEG